MIDKKYVKLSNNKVAVYRMLITPLFIKRLRTKVYLYKEIYCYLYGLPFTLPQSWVKETKDSLGEKVLTSKKLIKHLTMENNRETGNVIRLRA